MRNQEDSLCGYSTRSFILGDSKQPLASPQISATGSSDCCVDSVDALVGRYRSHPDTSLAYISDRKIISSESHYNSPSFTESLSPVSYPWQMEESQKRMKFTLTSVLSLRDGRDVHTLNSSVDLSSMLTDVSRHFNTLQQLSPVKQENKGWQSLIRTLFKKN